MKYTALIALLFICGCEGPEAQQKRQEKEAWETNCRDESRLLATTAGSPSYFTCPNRQHKMRVQIATAPSNEEAAALVFCECVKE